MNRRHLLKLLPLTGLVSLSGLQADETESTLDTCHTSADIEGPFFLPNSPETMQLASAGSAGTPLFITGTVYANDCMSPIQGALVDVWHANDAGGYENQNYRGHVLTDAGGNYAYQTILPGKYLNGAQFRPRHLHYKVSINEVELTTQIYFEGDTSIPIDPWASDPSADDRIIPLTPDTENQMHGVADIYLEIDPITSLGAELQERGSTYIRSIYPNPVRTEGKVVFYLKEGGQVQMQLLDLHGKIVGNYLDRYLNPGEHQFDFVPNNALDIKLPSGIYILRIVRNGAPASAKRMLIF
ncbi:MAG: T9SS type A sorting domain-containing protein [Bacteroidota bacterium]